MKAKYDRIGKAYNRTRTADAYLLSRLAAHLRPESGKTYLDIGCGTGNYTSALQAIGGDFIGVDPSDTMLAKAQAKNANIKWLQGTAEQIPLPHASVDSVVASLTLHHWTDLGKGFSELYRVLKPAGRIVIFTATPKQMEGYWLNHYFPTMLADSMKQMPTFASIETAMHGSNLEIVELEKYFIQDDLKDLFLYSGKHKPSLYFEPTVRQGISSFSALANREEVQRGLKALEADVSSGKINEVIQGYENDKGDYLFVVASKNMP